jgi:hypothetical protein
MVSTESDARSTDEESGSDVVDRLSDKGSAIARLLRKSLHEATEAKKRRKDDQLNELLFQEGIPLEKKWCKKQRQSCRTSSSSLTSSMHRLSRL